MMTDRFVSLELNEACDGFRIPLVTTIEEVTL